ncbi:MAG TPA: Gfo/Idh/MocA family oxidoreductase [Tepidisphaeraceae bacterium]|nr:Gfo/Idh/MocA family oxidoreductase [Tepidisphaeraceae bacterium]
MTTMDEVRWGILGCGDVCEVKSGPALYQTPRSRLVAVMRRDGAKAADFAKRHGVPRSYDDADALIGDPDVNAIYIATPPGSHRDLALKVAAAGKACYVEKPMARTHGECQQMVDAFAARKLPLFVAYYRRGMQRFIKAKELIDTGTLGTVTGITYRMLRPGHRGANAGWRLNLPDSGGGLFLDVGSHTLDILDFLLGPLANVAGVALNRTGPASAGVEDTVAMSFEAGGAVGTASWNFAADANEDLIQIHGTTATLSLSTFGHEPVRLTHGGTTDEFPFAAPAHVHSGLVEAIVTELTTGNPTSPSTAASAARTSRVMDDVLNNFYGDREMLFTRAAIAGAVP